MILSLSKQLCKDMDNFLNRIKFSLFYILKSHFPIKVSTVVPVFSSSTVDTLLNVKFSHYATLP